MNTTPVPAIGYVRVSTDRQATEVVTSLGDQEAAITQLAAQLGATVTTWYRDEGASGATVDGRPAFRELLAWCETHPRGRREEPGLVLVLNDSRFGRFPDPDEAAALRFRLKRAGWLVRFVESDGIEDVGMRHLVRAVGGAQATEYRRNLVANTRRGMKGAASQGFWTREAPFGFRRRVVFPPGSERVLELGQLKAPNEKVRLTPHEEEARVIRWVFESYASRKHSATAIAEELERTVSRKRWSVQVVHAILRNPAYAGDVVGGRRRGEKEDIKLTPERYGQRDAHVALVPRELWEAAQLRMAENRKLGRGSATTYLLSGLLVCPYCSRHYAGGGGGRSYDKRQVRERRRFYKDTGGIEGVCPGRIGTVTRHIIEDAVIDTMARTIRSAPVRRLIELDIDRALSAAHGGVRESEASLRAALRRTEQRRERLVALLADGTLLQSEAHLQLEQLRAEGAELGRRLEEVRFVARRAVPLAQERDRLIQAALDFPSQVKRFTGPALRSLVSLWLQRATFDKVTRQLELRIRRVPSLSLQPEYAPGRALEMEGADRALIRRVNLTQQGHSYRAALAAIGERS